MWSLNVMLLDQFLHHLLLVRSEAGPVHAGDQEECEGVDQQLPPQQLPQGGPPPEHIRNIISKSQTF